MYEAKGGEREEQEAEPELLIGKKREMVYLVIIFIRKSANKSSNVELLFLEFVKSNFETLGYWGAKIFL